MRRALTTAAAIALLAFTAPAIAADQDGEGTGAGTSMMLVMDASGSMAEKTGGGSTRIQAAKDGLNAVIDGLPPQQQVGFRVFGATDVPEDSPKACTDSQRIVDLGTDNRDDLRRAVADYEPVGWTPTSYALQQAAQDLGSTGQRTIVLVSDGEPTCDPDPCTVAADIAKTGVDVRIDVVGFDVSGSARATLRCVAEKGRGTYYDADDAASLNQALTVTSTRAARPFDLTGTPVEGTTDYASAPDLTTGQYTDTIPPRGTRIHHRLKRTAPGTTFHVGAVVSGVRGDLGASANVGIFRGDDLSCYIGTTYGLDLTSANPIYYGGTSSWKPDPESPCMTDPELFTTIERSVGDVDGRPIELAVYEEPPITSTVVAGQAATEPQWRTLTAATPTTGVVPGTSIASAPVVDPGTYALDISAGETQVLAIGVDWGQSVRAQLDATLNDGVRDAAAGGSEIAVNVLSPMRNDITVSQYAREPGDWTTGALANITENVAFRTGAMSWTVNPSNRAGNETVRRGASLAGIHYVVVTLEVRGDEANLPYTLTLERTDEGADVAPTYAQVDGLTPPSAESRLVDSPLKQQADSTDAADEDGAAKQADDGSSVPWVWIAGGTVLVLALVTAVAVVVLRRRRA